MRAISLTIWSLILAGHLAFAQLEAVPPAAALFLRCYPATLVGFSNNHLLFRNGAKVEFDDGQKKDFKALLADATPLNQLAQAYPVGPESYNPPEYNYDPGRFRCAGFFRAMYGNSPSEVESHLVTILWMPRSTHKTVRITSVNGVDRALAAVSAELDQLPEEQKKYVTTTSGTYNWRPIAGSDQLSAHAFGIAIDINSDYSDYWRWAKPNGESKIAYRNRIPHSIVEIFERHGFIWGGKWYHYDTM
ncbi:MAG TPA: M15 family metallopeptidase, partial [Chthoniobacterales bacterium]|nr:M15 family metallopeptidase [Chthoniobacterales bacterium]